MLLRMAQNVKFNSCFEMGSQLAQVGGELVETQDDLKFFYTPVSTLECWDYRPVCHPPGLCSVGD